MTNQTPHLVQKKVKNHPVTKIHTLSLPKGAVSLAKRVSGLPPGDYVILVKRSDSGIAYDVLVSSQKLATKKT